MPPPDRDDGSGAEVPRNLMTIHQLAERSGLPARRIRYYVAEGLMPPPIGRGRAAHYRLEHLNRLRQIQALRDVNLGLDEIRARLGEPAEVSLAAEPRAGMWRRWELAPGIELQARSDLGPDDAALVRVLVGVARQLLSERHGAVSDGRDARDGVEPGDADRGHQEARQAI